jgi:hypothetical protein
MVNSLAETRARDAARQVLRAFWVQKPDDIDVLAFAAKSRLSIIEGGLDTSDGRIVANAGQPGFIRIRSGISSVGRSRFIIAHELGHFHLHKRATYTDNPRNLSSYGPGSIESEANFFASELLMPNFLFEERVRKIAPSHANLQQLADEFRTSELSTAIQYLSYTKEPCALVFAKHGQIEWKHGNSAWEWPIRDVDVHKFSGAGEFFANGTIRTGMIETPAGAWIPQFRIGGDETIREDALVWASLGIVVSLLWVDGML